MDAKPCPVCAGRLVPGPDGLEECSRCGLLERSDGRTERCFHPAGACRSDLLASKRKIFKAVLDLLEESLPERGRLLDAGCASGRLLEQAAARGWQVSGVEADPALASEASRAGLQVISSPLESAALEPASFDAVTVLEVFSQMRDPAAGAAAAYKALRPGGVLCLREFNAGFHLAWRQPPLSFLAGLLRLSPAVEHQHNFRAASLRALLSGAGFREIRIINSPMTSGDPYRSAGCAGPVMLGAFKFLYYAFSRALEAATAGRVLAGSALLAVARK